MSTETQRLKRWSLHNYLPVFNQDTETLIGHLVDINLKGMKLESLKPLPVDQQFRLFVEIVTERIPLEVTSVWSRREEKSILYNTGFRFVDPSSKTKQNIECLVEALKQISGNATI